MEVGDSMGELLFFIAFAGGAQAAVSPGLQKGLEIGSQIGSAATSLMAPRVGQNGVSAQESFVSSTFKNSVSACVAAKTKGIGAVKKVACTKPNEALLKGLEDKECESYESSEKVETEKSGTSFAINESAVSGDVSTLKKFKDSLEAYGKCSKDETRAEFFPAQQKIDLLTCQKDAMPAVNEAINNYLAPLIQKNQQEFDTQTQVLGAMDAVRGQAAMMLGIDEKGEPVAGAGLGISGAIKLHRERSAELASKKAELVAKVQQANLATRKASQGLEQRVAAKLFNCLKSTPISVKDSKGRLTTTLCRQEGSAAGGVYGKAGMRPCGFLEYAAQVSASTTLTANGASATNARSRASADTAEKNAMNVQCEIAMRLGITEGMDACPAGLRAQAAGAGGVTTISGVDQNSGAISEFSTRFGSNLTAVYSKAVATCQNDAKNTRSFETDPDQNSQYQVDLGEAKVARNDAGLQIAQAIEQERTLYNESLKAFPIPPEIIDPSQDQNCTGTDLMKRMSCIDFIQRQNQNLLAGTGSRRFSLKIPSTNSAVKGLDVVCSGLEPCEKLLLDYSKNMGKQQGQVAQARNAAVMSGNAAIQQQMTQAAAAISRLHQEKIKSTANDLSAILKGLDVSEVLELSALEKVDSSDATDKDKGPLPLKPDALQAALAANGGVLDLNKLDLSALTAAMNDKIKEKKEEVDTKIEDWTTKVAEIDKTLKGIVDKAGKKKVCSGELALEPGSGRKDDDEEVTAKKPCDGIQIKKECVDLAAEKLTTMPGKRIVTELNNLLDLLAGDGTKACSAGDQEKVANCLDEVAEDKPKARMNAGIDALRAVQAK